MKKIMLFNKWDYESVEIKDPSLLSHIAIKKNFSTYIPHTAGKYIDKKFKKNNYPIVERVACALMMHGRNSGKKLKTIKIIKDAFELINLITKQNPIQILVDAIVNSGPREDSTKVGSVGSVRRQSVDVSPLRRVNVGIYLLSMGARNAAFKNTKTIAECLADELVNASRNSSNSFAIKKKDEIERIAKTNR
ncbi:40S ribosomal protein S5 (nucleomorph) [Cryptomonas paramecium]|uniref:40S ribosomal protein S5 n=1 Tax=Cryptomonas paramaecium TaxID=2898 RepID=F2HH81_9CRYP|nr:40S ribosomal protein S5 [Cryptomonas paramecium]AEA38677.1 40S ribosomal protein S5 [Cryptomonas paramecium]|mmetsp:Transcript_52166/g.136372  ORF Transcript_52166/g.136372 Transcript_52166/m.136372 type:complete len:192 (+) Transcript_52166:1130-1705(+)